MGKHLRRETIALVGGPGKRDLVLTAADRKALERVVLDPDAKPAVALRSTAMLMAVGSGMSLQEVADHVGVTPSSVRRWRMMLADKGVDELTRPAKSSRYESEALRCHPWVGAPSMRIAMIFRVQAEVLRSSCCNLKQRMFENLLHSSQYLRRAGGEAEHADQIIAATIIEAARKPVKTRAAWGAGAAQRAASGAMSPVEQAALVDAAVQRIVRPVSVQSGWVSPGDFSILHTLARLGPIRTKQLAEAEHISRVAVAVRMPALEQRGFLTRTAVSSNTFVLTATERTRALVSGANPAGIERFVDGFSELPPHQRADLTAALQRLSGISATPGPDAVEAYRGIARLSRMMDPADPSLLTARGADALVNVAQSGPLRSVRILGPESNPSSAYLVAGELERLKYIERIADATAPHRAMLTATPTGRELATALTAAPETVAAAPFTAAVARLDPDDRSVLTQGLAELIKLIGR